MASPIPFRTLTHKQRVLRLYKMSLRMVENYVHERLVFRYQALLMRERFEKNRNLDLVTATQLVQDGEQELWDRQHWQPKMWPNSVTGNAYGRVPHIPDWVLDYWHPLEKAQYPDYFATREKRKAEYIKMWDKEYGQDVPPTGHH